MNLPKRANTDKEKEFVLKAILELWKKVPELRLGQLIENAKYRPDKKRDLFYIEDWDLLDDVVNLVNKYNEKK